MHDLPSLRCLRTFEVVGRLLSYQLAEQELGIGIDEILEQMGRLEGEIGVVLFEMWPPGLTPEGRRYHLAVTSMFDSLRKATSEVCGIGPQLRIRSDITLARYWLAPRLSGFRSKYPEISIIFESSACPAEHLFSHADAEMHLRSAPVLEQCCDRIFRNQLVPVCSSQYLASRTESGSRRGLTLLRKGTLLATMSRQSDWKDWARAAGFSDLPFADMLMCESSVVALRAAELGEGIAITTLELVGATLASGTLVAPYAFTLDRGDTTYYLIYSRDKLMREEFVVFRDWLLSQSTFTKEMHS